MVTLLMVGLITCAMLLPGGNRTTLVADQIDLPAQDALIIALRRMTLRFPSCAFFVWERETDRLLKVGQLESCGRFGTISWLPDGTRFFYQSGFDLGQYASISLFDGHEMRQITQPMLNAGGLSFSPDQRYFATMSCRSSHAEVVVVTAYSTEDGAGQCSVVVSGSTIVGCGSAQDQCTLPLENGNTWQLQLDSDVGSSLFHVCDAETGCTEQDTSTLTPAIYESTRYTVEAESCNAEGLCLPNEQIAGYYPRRFLTQLRIRDLENAVEFVYPLPGYEVIAWAWSPPHP